MKKKKSTRKFMPKLAKIKAATKEKERKRSAKPGSKRKDRVMDKEASDRYAAGIEALLPSKEAKIPESELLDQSSKRKRRKIKGLESDNDWNESEKKLIDSISAALENTSNNNDFTIEGSSEDEDNLDNDIDDWLAETSELKESNSYFKSLENLEDEDDVEEEIIDDVEDDDVEDIDLDSIEKEKMDVNNDLDSLINEINSLEKEDPEFYEYLKANDAKLLEFKDEPDEQSVPMDTKSGRSMTMGLLKGLANKAIVDKSVPALKQLLMAFRAAVHSDDTDVSDKVYKYNFPSDIVQQKLLVWCFARVSGLFDHHMKRSDKKQPGHSRTWNKNLKKMIRSYINNMIHYCNSLGDNEEMVLFLLNSADSMLPYMSHFPKYCKSFLKVLSSKHLVCRTPRIRLRAFLSIYRMAIEIPYPFIESCIKEVYMAFVKHSRFTSPHTIELIQFLGNAVVEIFGLDFKSSYQFAFVYIRQLAIQLRTALISKEKEAFRSVFNWQVINSVRIWARVLSTFRAEDELFPLIYPFIQVTLGIAGLNASSRYYPIRFHCIKSLLLVAEHVNTFFPIIPLLLEMIENPDLHKKTKQGKTRPFNFNFLIIVSKSASESYSYQEGVLNNTIELILNFMTLYSCSISFPEFAYPVVASLSTLSSKTSISRVKKQLKNLRDRILENIEWVKTFRKDSSISPGDVEAIDSFLLDQKINKKSPLWKYFKSYKATESQRKLLISDSLEPAEKKKMQNADKDLFALNKQQLVTDQEKENSINNIQRFENVQDILGDMWDIED